MFLLLLPFCFMGHPRAYKRAWMLRYPFHCPLSQPARGNKKLQDQKWGLTSNVGPNGPDVWGVQNYMPSKKRWKRF